MKLLLSFIFLYWIGLGYSQTYRPMPSSGAVWIDYWNTQYGATNSNNCQQIRIEMIGDSLLNGINYQILKRTTEARRGNFSFPCSTFVFLYTDILFMRNDSINKKVFIRPTYLNQDTILYDFNLSIGDTIKESFQYQNASGWDITVESIDSILIQNNFHKRYKLRHHLTQDSIYLIEGVGSASGFLNTYDHFIGGIFELQCFQLNGQAIFPATPTNCGILTSINQEHPVEQSIQLFPNPVDDFITIENYQSIRSIRVLNLQGKQFLFEYFPNEKIDLRELNKGIYFIRFESIDNNIYIRKIVKR